MALTKRFQLMFAIWPLCTIIFMRTISITSGIICGETSKWQYLFKGEKTPVKNAQKADHIKGQSYLVIDPMYTIECCGHISKWELYVKNAGTVKMQVWRPVNNNSFTYELRGQTSVTVSSKNKDKLITVTLPPSKYIAVNTGDVIGWSYPGIDMIMYKKKMFGNTIFTASKMPPLKPGDLFTFPLNVISDRSYAVKVSLSSGNAPVFQDPPLLVDVEVDSPWGTSLANLTGSDADGQDVMNFTLLKTEHGYKHFEIDAISGEIFLSSNLSVSGMYNLNVRVSDICGMYSDTSLDIFVKEAQEHDVLLEQQQVIFYNLPAQIKLHEDTSHEKLLHEVNVTGESGQSDIACYLMNMTTRKSPFLMKRNIDYYGIYIRANAKLTYDVTPTYVLLVRCIVENHVASSTLTVNLIRNRPPVVHNLPASVFLSAKTTKVGDVLYKVNTTDYEKDPITFTINCSTNLCPFQMISSGLLICKREMLSIKIPAFDVDVFASDHRNKVRPLSLSVVLTEMNNPPVLHPTRKIFYIHENTSPGTVIHTFNASDVDGDRLIFEAFFQPVTGFSHFHLNTSGNLIVSNNLDFESLNSHTFMVSVMANDGITVSESLNVTLIIVDANEPPRFSSDNYTVFTYEGSVGSEATPQSLLQVRDVDKSDNITFYISGGSNSMNFFIDGRSGQIKFSVLYDVRIMPKTVQLNITARDSGGLECFTTVTIMIRALNWKPHLNNLPWRQMVPESARHYRPALYTITAFDPDVNDTKSFRVTYFPAVGAAKFHVNPSTGEVSIAEDQILDFESGPREYVLTVVVNDGTADSKSANLTLQITDVNEPPTFNQPIYYVETLEMIKGKRLWALADSMITDPDIGDKHTYSLDEGPNSTFFAFDPLSNQLAFAVDYDTRKMPSHITLTVRVTDQGGLSGTAQIEVSIQSINKGPVIKNLPQFLLVPEITPVNTVIFKVGGFDPDPGDVLLYEARYLDPRTPLKFLFNQSSGEVILNGKLDYELMSIKEFTIKVSVSDGHLSSGQYDLTLSLIDSNEPPQFSAPKYHVWTFENQNGVILTKEAIFDVFEPDEGDLYHYKITGGLNHSLFGIDSITGQLHFAVNYTLSTMPRRVIIDVSVFDISGLNDTTKVEILVKPVNRVPRIVNLPQNIYVREELAPGSKVFTVDVFDEDSMDPRIFKVTFDPPQGAALFTFDDKNGELLIGNNQVINYEALGTLAYTLTISVSDGQASSEPATLGLQVVDVNEAPHFSSRLYFIDVIENKGGTVLPMSVPFEVFDPDANDSYKFFIMNAENSSWFNIEPINGNISFAIDYDVRLLPANVFLVIAVKDESNLQDTALVNITIRPINKRPRLLNLPQVVPVAENYPPEHEIITIHARDEDPWDTLTYQLYFSPTDGASRFGINQTNGALFLFPGQDLDYETIPWKEYILTVIVGDGLAMTNPVNLTLEVIDVNEPPVFTEKIYYVSTNEGPPGTVLEESKVVSSTDPDKGDRITYNLDPVDGNATMFTINRSAGYLRFAVHYDCTMMPHDVTLWLIARDRSGLTDRAEVRILVNHLNRLPILRNLPATIRLPENLSSQLIYVILVEDPDPNDPVFFVATVTPASGIEKFLIDSQNGAVTLRDEHILDYETENKYTITITVYDGHNHTSPEALTIFVEDVNEAPSFSMPRYYISTYEGPAGTVLPDPFFQVTDPDKEEVFTYYLTGSKHYHRFVMDPSNGHLRYAVNYDVDQMKMPSRVVLEVKANDTGGLIATTYVEIQIDDVNDNAPVFNQSSYTIFARINDPVGFRYMTVQATDIDSNLNAKIVFQIDDFKELQYFGASEAGDIYLERPFKYDFKGDIRFLMVATDQGSPVQSSVVMVKVILQELLRNRSFSETSISVTPQGIARAGYFDQPENLSWFAASVLLLTLLQIIGVLFLYRCLSRKCSKKNKKDKEKTVQISPKKTVVVPEEKIKDDVAEISTVKNIISGRPSNFDEKPWETSNISRYDFWNTGKIEGDSFLSMESSSGEISVPLQPKKRVMPADMEDRNKRFLPESRWEMPQKPKPYSQFTRDRILNAWLN